MDKQVLKFTVTDFISVNHYLSYRSYIKNGKPVTSNYKTTEAKRFQKEITKYIKKQAKIQGWITDPNPMQHYYVDAVYYFPRIDMDCNNYHKVTFDAITDSGVVWVDDNMACERVLKVMYDSKNPRIEYTIYKTDFTGIFDNEQQLNEFEDKCKTCARYRNNCSILSASKTGKITDEVNENFECSKYKEYKPPKPKASEIRKEKRRKLWKKNTL